MEESVQAINAFLVHAFHDILRTEEGCLTRSGFSDLTLSELHVIEAVGQAQREGDNRAARIAARLRVTPGTLTTAVNLLVRKGYLGREEDARDRRVRRIVLTGRGQRADEAHARFHAEMVHAALSGLTPEEARAFARGLDGVSRFFREKYYDEKGVAKP